MRKLRLKEVKNQRMESSCPGTLVGRQNIYSEKSQSDGGGGAPSLMREIELYPGGAPSRVTGIKPYPVGVSQSCGETSPCLGSPSLFVRAQPLSFGSFQLAQRHRERRKKGPAPDPCFQHKGLLPRLERRCRQ